MSKMYNSNIFKKAASFLLVLTFVTAQIFCFPVAASSTVNLAAGKLPTSSTSAFKNLSYATDGIISTSNYADSYTGTGLEWVQLDLGASYNIGDIKLWHYFGDARKYHDVIVQLSNDSTFTKGVTTVYNNDTNNSAGLGIGTNSEYPETSAGLDIQVNAVNARYARFYSNGSTVNSYNHYGEIQIFKANNLAANIIPTTSSSGWTNLAMITDGIISTSNYADSSTGTGLQWAQLNLGAACNLSDIKVWHYFGDTRKYHDVIVMVSNDPNFGSGNYTIVYNNDTNNSAGFGIGTNSEYAESSTGLDIPFTAVNAQYIRLYSNGSTANNYNHYGEVEVYAGAATVAPTSITLNKTAAA